MLRVLRYRVRLFVALLPLRYRPGTATNPAMREFQQAHNRVVLRDWPAPARALILAAEVVVWPFLAAWMAFQLSGKWGASVCALTGRSRRRQMLDAFRYALTYRLRPYDYYHFNFWRPTDSPSVFLTDGRPQMVFRALNRGSDLSALDDKRKFWDLCQAHRLSTPALLLSFFEGRVELRANDASLAQDLFFKQRRGLRGDGAMRWFYDPANGSYTSGATGATLDRPALIEHYRRLSPGRSYIVQPRLFDHPEIADLGNGTVSVVRMITVVRPDGSIGEFSSMFKMPTGQSILTNLSDGAVFSPIDSARGVLRQAFTGALGKPQYDDHPVTGVRVVDRALPFWREAVELGCAAHAQFAYVACIGWDIVLTAQGPVLLEGNHGMALTPFNFPPNVPLGRTELPHILTWHLQRKYGDLCNRRRGGHD